MAEEEKGLIGTIDDLPMLPSVANTILKLGRDPDCTVRDMEEVIQKDPPLAAKLLRLVNSSFYGLRTKVGSIKEAIIFIGIKRIRTFCLSVSIFDSLLKYIKSPVINVNRIWSHAIGTAGAAREIAEIKAFEEASCCFSAGLLHDIGKIILIKFFPEKYQEVMAQVNTGVSSVEAEKKILNITHTETGAELCRHWKLPYSIFYPARYHHSPEDAPVNYQHWVSSVAAASFLSNEVLRNPNDTVIPQGTLNFLNLTDEEIEKLRQVIYAEGLESLASLL